MRVEAAEAQAADSLAAANPSASTEVIPAARLRPRQQVEGAGAMREVAVAAVACLLALLADTAVAEGLEAAGRVGAAGSEAAERVGLARARVVRAARVVGAARAEANELAARGVRAAGAEANELAAAMAALKE